MLTAVAIFPKERDAFYHERVSAAKHSTATFLLSYTVQELPMQIVASLLYSVIFVYGFNLQGSFRRFVEFAVGIWGALNFGESVGIIFSAWIRNGGLSISLVSCALTVQAQLSGIMSVSIPHWLQIIAWAAPTKYYSRIQIINEMEGLNFDCDAQSIASGVCIARTGEELLDTFRIEDRNTGEYDPVPPPSPALFVASRCQGGSRRVKWLSAESVEWTYAPLLQQASSSGSSSPSSSSTVFWLTWL